MRQAALALLAVGLVTAWTLAEEKKADKKEGDKDRQALLDPQQFVLMAGYINYGEIAAGTLATRLGSTPEIKQYGMRLVQDHSKANQEMLQLAAKDKFTVAGGPDQKHQAIGEKLAMLQGQAFDKEFLQTMVKGHKHAIQMFEMQAKEGKNEDVKAMAERLLPTLRAHLKEAERLQGNNTGGATGTGTNKKE